MEQVHLIGNAHLDPVWLWRWQEGYAEALATFRSALDRMAEFPGFVFTCAGAAYYQWIEETDPGMFEEIRARVAEGRWVIVGGWWIQPDCNAPSGESFARQSLVGQSYFKSRFGVTACVGYNVDSFGHNAMLPQILRLSGMDAYVFMRPNDRNEKQYPFPQNAFMWQSPDGQSVAAYRIPMGYGSHAFHEVADKAKQHLEMAEKSGQPMMCFYGVGNHGGGPTIANLNALERLQSETPGKYAYSSPNAYFDALNRAGLPVLRDELQHHASGCYTAVMQIKKLNRMAEARLTAAEKYTVLARSLGVGGSGEPLDTAWKNVLFNQFHDILGGCSIRSAYEDAFESYGESLSIAARVTNRALQAIAWNIDTSQGLPVNNSKHDFRLWEQDGRGVPVVVFNPHAFTLRAPIRTGVQIAGARDAHGNPVATQSVRSQVTNGKQDKWESALIAEVPPLGWRLYWLYQNEEIRTESARALAAGGDFLENDWLRAEFDRESGAISRLYDKAAGRELLASPAHARVVDEEDSDTWAHNIFAFRKVIGGFSDAKVSVAGMGEVCAALRVESSYGKSTLTATYTLYRELPGLHAAYAVHWHERHRMLKLCFPTPMAAGTSVSSIPFGFLERPANGNEQPMQGWVMLKEQGYGLGIATDSRTAYDAQQGELRITALRSPIYADHYGERDEFCEFTEQGEQRFALTLMGVQGDPIALVREAGRLSGPPEHIVGTYHGGRLGAQGSGIGVDVPNVEASAIKYAQDGSGDVIVRLYETQGRAVRARIELKTLGAGWMADFGPMQILTFRVSGGRAWPVNILEEDA